MSAIAPRLFDDVDRPVAERKQRVKQARAGQRGARDRDRRVTSWSMSVEDELLLDALRDHYGTDKVSVALRRSLQFAAEAQGVTVATPAEEDAPAA